MSSVGATLASCSGTHEQTHVLAGAPPRGSVAPTANVPALLSSSIKELRQRLGAPAPLPQDFSDPLTNHSSDRTETRDSSMAFRTGGLLLIANYDARSGQVHDLLLLGHHEDSLMSRASLRSNAAEYLVLPVFYAGSRSRLMGIRVVSTN